MPIIIPPGRDDEIVESDGKLNQRGGAWSQKVSRFAESREDSGSPEGVYDALRGQKYIDIDRNQIYWKAIDGGTTGWKLYGNSSTTEVCVYTEDDFPDPVDGIITLAEDTEYKICAASVTVSYPLHFNTNTYIVGAREQLTTLTGNTDDPFIEDVGQTGIRIQHLTLENAGSGDLIYVDVGYTTGEVALFLQFVRLEAGIIRLVTGISAVFSECTQVGTTQIIQSNNVSFGGVRNIIFSTLTGLRNENTTDTPAVLFETGSVTNEVRFTGTFVSSAFSAPAVRFEEGITIVSMVAQSCTFTHLPGSSDSAIFEVGNPDDIQQGTLIDSPYQDLGDGSTFLQCNPSIQSPITLGAMTVVGGCTNDGINLIAVDTNSNLIRRYEELTDVFDDSVSTPQTDVIDVEWYRGRLLSLDDDGNLWVHAVGFSASTTQSWTGVGQGEETLALATDGSNIFVAAGLQTIYTYARDVGDPDYSVGSSLTGAQIATTVISTVTEIAGLAYDGVNWVILDDTGGNLTDMKIHVMRGKSSVIQYSIDVPDGITGITVLNGQFVYVGNSTQSYVSNGPLTFDHSSLTWEITNIGTVLAANFIVESAARGGSNYSTLQTTIDSAPGISISSSQRYEWVELSDSSDDLRYAPLAEQEKAGLYYTDDTTTSGEYNGTIEWRNPRTITRALNAAIEFGSENSDELFEIGIFVNDELVPGTNHRGASLGTSQSTSVTTPTITRTMEADDLIQLKIRNLGKGGSASDTTLYLLFATLSVF